LLCAEGLGAAQLRAAAPPGGTHSGATIVLAKEERAIAIPDSYLQELKSRADIEQLISPYVSLRRSGRTLMGLCPFHNEKSPSFAVYPDSNSFYCFGCGAGGDAVSFLMRMERLDYLEAVKALSQRVGMQLPEDHYDDGLAKRRMRVLSANREAARFFHAQLREEQGRAGLQYWLEQRKLSPQTVTRFGLGYAPEEWGALLWHMRAQGYTPDELTEANLVTRSEKEGKTHYYDRFRGRVMVPILDLRGNVVAFGGRVLDDGKPKYINTSDTLAYKKGRDIFALHFAKNTGAKSLILVEGYMDVIALHQAGFPQAVACLGTALTAEQAQLLSRYAEEVTLCYDADEAGQAATERALRVLSKTNLKLKVARPSGGKDPDEMIRTYGAERFRQLLEGAANDIEYQLLRARGGLELDTPNGKNAYLNECAKILARCGSIAQDIYAGRLAEELGVGKTAILSQIALSRKRAERQQERQEQRNLARVQQERSLRIDPRRAERPAAARAEEMILGLLQLWPDFYPKARDKLNAGIFVTPFNRELAAKLLGRLEAGLGIDTELLTGMLTAQELDEATRMKIACRALERPLAEFEGCLEALLREKRTHAVDAAALDDNGYRDLFAQLRHDGGT
jgi:DNA primase